MHESIVLNNLEIFSMMCYEDVDVNMKDDEGRTPLMIACQTGAKEFVKILLEFEADLQAKDNNGSKANFQRIITIVGTLFCINLVACLCLFVLTGWTADDIAAMNKQDECRQLLGVVPTSTNQTAAAVVSAGTHANQ